MVELGDSKNGHLAEFRGRTRLGVLQLGRKLGLLHLELDAAGLHVALRCVNLRKTILISEAVFLKNG
jgi:hypothetical protein